MTDKRNGPDGFPEDGFPGYKLTLYLMRAVAALGLLSVVWRPGLVDAQSTNQEPERADSAISSSRVGEAALLDSDKQDVKLIESVFRYYSNDSARVHRIAVALVREAKAVAVSPRLLAAIMLVENPWLDPVIESVVGAKGLMQVMPFHAGHWAPCGDDLAHIEDNICTGARIFAHYYDSSGGDLKVALLRYNGCVTGRNTPSCHGYPDHVIARVPRRVSEDRVQAFPTDIDPVAMTRPDGMPF